MHPNPPPALTVRAIKAVGVEVPMTHVLGTSKGRITRAPLLLIDVETEEGVTWRSYLWSYFRQAMPAIASILGAVEECVKGDRATPQAFWDKLNARFALIGVQGVVRMAMAGFDVACWDAASIAAGLPLATMVGAAPRRIPAYNSCGLGLMPLDELADEAEQLLANGFRAMKLRLGYPTLKEDIAAVRAVRNRIPAGVALMVDYNQALTLDDALERAKVLETHSKSENERAQNLLKSGGITEKDFKGYPTLVFFGFTNCPDVCPTTLFEVSEIFRELGKDGDRVKSLFVSVDPERDTPEKLKDYLASFDPHLIGATGDAASITAIGKAYRVYYKKVPLDGGGYTMDHTAIVYLMDKDGRFVAPFNMKRRPEEAAADLRRYL